MANRSKRKRRIRITLFLLVALLAGGYYADKKVKEKGYDGLFSFLFTTGSNYADSDAEAAESIAIQISDEAYQKLVDRRQQALDRGIMTNDGDNYVKAEITHNNKTIKAEIRLKGHMTDHLEGEKWSFRVKMKKGHGLMGMSRVSLQHPGTRNYIHEWIFHQLLKREGVVALRYQFINVTLNGNDLGIYAMEEHFGQELLEDNQRLHGPIVRFNPAMYWVHRIHELDRIRIIEEYARYQSAHLEPFTKGEVEKDSVLLNHFVNAQLMMDGFRRGKLTASEVFEVEKMARMHAIIDLVGGHHSLDWSDVKFYYNPVIQKLEPVGYESFGVHEIDRIGGSYKYAPGVHSDYHRALFSDNDFFSAYVQSLERIADKAYLDAFFQDIDTTLQHNLSILYSEFPYKDYTNATYYKNQEHINAILDIPRAFHAFMETEGDTTMLKVGSIAALPVAITGASINDSLVALSPIIVAPKLPGTAVQHTAIPLPVAVHEGDDIALHYQLPGGTQQHAVEVFPYPYLEEDHYANNYAIAAPNIQEFECLYIDDTTQTIRIKAGEWVINRDMIVPAGYTLKAEAGVVLVLNDSAAIISHAPIHWKGHEDIPIVVTSSDSTGQGVMVLNTTGVSILEQVIFRQLQSPARGTFGFNAAVSFYNSPLRMNHCRFEHMGAAMALRTLQTKVELNNVLFEQLAGTAWKGDYITGNASQLVIHQCGNDGVNLRGSHVSIANAQISGVDKGVLIRENGTLKGNAIAVHGSNTGVVSKDHASVTIDQLTVKQSKKGLRAYRKGKLYDGAVLKVNGFEHEAVDMLYDYDKQSRIIIDGKTIESQQ